MVSRLGGAISCRGKRRGWQRERGDFKPSIRVPRIAAAVLALQLLKSVQPENFLRHTRLLQFGNESVPFRIQIRADVMRHLPGRVTQTDSLIEGDGTKPNLLAVMKPVPAPESDVMPLTRAVPNRLLEG